LRFSTKRTCMIEGCKRNIYAKRVCINHYERLKSYGILEKLNFTKDKVKPCLVYNCKSYDYEEGYCLDQLELIKEYGSPYVPRVVTYCAICNKLHFKFGLCENHYEELHFFNKRRC